MRKNRARTRTFSAWSIVDLLPAIEEVFVVSTDAGGVITSLTPGASAVLGYSGEELVNRTTIEGLLDPPDCAGLPPRTKLQPRIVTIAELMTDARSPRAWTWRTFDGRAVKLNCVARTLRDSRGVAGYVFVAVPAVPAQHTPGPINAADTYGSLLQLALGSADPITVGVVSADFRWREVAGDALATRGITETSNGFVGESLPISDAAKLCAAIERANRLCLPDRLALKDGRTLEVSARPAGNPPEANDDGSLIVAIRDVGDDSVTTESETDDSPETLDLATAVWHAFDASPAASAVVSADFHFVRANQCFAQLLGRDAASLARTSVLDIVHCEDLVALKVDNDRPVRCRLLPAHGDPIEVALRIARTPGSALIQLHADPIRLELDSLSVAHNLRTPLTNVCGYLELLLDERTATLPEPHHGLVEAALRNAGRLERNISELVTRVTAGAIHSPQ